MAFDIDGNLRVISHPHLLHALAIGIRQWDFAAALFGNAQRMAQVLPVSFDFGRFRAQAPGGGRFDGRSQEVRFTFTLGQGVEIFCDARVGLRNPLRELLALSLAPSMATKSWP